MPPVLNLVLVAGLVLFPALARAQCTGTGVMERFSDDQRAALEAAVADTPYPEGLVWEAARGDARITIVGTMHLWDPRLDDLAAGILPLLDAADHALFEMTGAEQAQLLQALTDDPSITTIVSGPTLPDLLDPPTWAALSQAASDHGIPSFMAAKMQPWFLATTLSMPSCAMAAMAEGRLGLDFILMEAADEQGITTGALEPWDTLLRLFDSVTMDEQIDLLRLSIVAPELQNAMFISMLDGYFAGDVARIWEMNRFAMELMPDTVSTDFITQSEALLLVQRNHDWIPVIEAASADHDNLFVGAGAAHLPGEDGVLRLLEENGWTLRRLDG